MPKAKQLSEVPGTRKQTSKTNSFWASDIKNVIETEFNVNVTKVHTINDLKGRKKAIIKLSNDNPAVDVATKLGIM